MIPIQIEIEKSRIECVLCYWTCMCGDCDTAFNFVGRCMSNEQQRRDTVFISFSPLSVYNTYNTSVYNNSNDQQRHCRKENVFLFSASPYEYYYLFIHMICIFFFVFFSFFWRGVDHLLVHWVRCGSSCLSQFALHTNFERNGSVSVISRVIAHGQFRLNS